MRKAYARSSWFWIAGRRRGGLVWTLPLSLTIGSHSAVAFQAHRAHTVSGAAPDRLHLPPPHGHVFLPHAPVDAIRPAPHATRHIGTPSHTHLHVTRNHRCRPQVQIRGTERRCRSAAWQRAAALGGGSFLPGLGRSAGGVVAGHKGRGLHLATRIMLMSGSARYRLGWKRGRTGSGCPGSRSSSRVRRWRHSLAT